LKTVIFENKGRYQSGPVAKNASRVKWVVSMLMVTEFPFHNCGAEGRGKVDWDG